MSNVRKSVSTDRLAVDLDQLHTELAASAFPASDRVKRLLKGNDYLINLIKILKSQAKQQAKEVAELKQETATQRSQLADKDKEIAALSSQYAKGIEKLTAERNHHAEKLSELKEQIENYQLKVGQQIEELKSQLQEKEKDVATLYNQHKSEMKKLEKEFEDRVIKIKEQHDEKLDALKTSFEKKSKEAEVKAQKTNRLVKALEKISDQVTQEKKLLESECKTQKEIIAKLKKFYAEALNKNKKLEEDTNLLKTFAVSNLKSEIADAKKIMKSDIPMIAQYEWINIVTDKNAKNRAIEINFLLRMHPTLINVNVSDLDQPAKRAIEYAFDEEDLELFTLLVPQTDIELLNKYEFLRAILIKIRENLEDDDRSEQSLQMEYQIYMAMLTSLLDIPGIHFSIVENEQTPWDYACFHGIAKVFEALVRCQGLPATFKLVFSDKVSSNSKLWIQQIIEQSQLVMKSEKKEEQKLVAQTVSATGGGSVSSMTIFAQLDQQSVESKGSNSSKTVSVASPHLN